MIATRHLFGVALIIAAALLAGCAGSLGDMRPIMAVDGKRVDMQDAAGKGRALLLTGQYGLAIDALTQVVHAEPGNVRALALLAVAYDHLKRYDLADRYHAEALQIDPNSVAALNNWGYSYLVRGDKARATGLLQRAAAVSRDQPIVAANLALVSGAAAGAGVRQSLSIQSSETAAGTRLSQHVTIVRRVGRLVRLAHGVQMLLTVSEPAEELASPRMTLAAERSGAAFDNRFELFRQLFSLMDGEPPVASSEVARRTPFTSFAEVDDFSRP